MGWTSLFGGGKGLGSNLFGGGVFGGSDGNWGGGFDWGSVWGDIGQGIVGDWLKGNSGNIIGDLLGGSGGSKNNSGGGFMDTLGNLFGGGQGGSGNIWGALLSGLGGAAQAMFDEDNIREMGKEQRKTRAFEAELLDYYKQKEKQRKRVALDSYGQFSLLNKWAPNYSGDRPVEVPNKPGP